MAALVAVMNDAVGPALFCGHVEGVEDEAGTEMVGHRPTDDAPAPNVDTTARKRKPAQVGRR